MTQKEIWEKQLSLQCQARLLIDEQIHLLGQMIASVPHEPTQAELEAFFEGEHDETTCRSVSD